MLEVVSGDHGNYTEQLSRKAQNGLNSDWRNSGTAAFDLKSFEHIGK